MTYAREYKMLSKKYNEMMRATGNHYETLRFADMADAKKTLAGYGYKYVVNGVAYRDINDIYGGSNDGLKINKARGGYYTATVLVEG